MKTPTLSLTAILLVMALVQPAHAVQIEFSGIAPENSDLSLMSRSDVVISGFSNKLPLYHGIQIFGYDTDYTTSVSLVTDDVSNSVSFTNITFSLPSGKTLVAGQSFATTPSGFGQPAVPYTVNVFVDSFTLSFAPYANTIPLIPQGGTTYSFASAPIPGTLATLQFGGHYEVTSESTLIASSAFLVNPQASEIPYLRGYSLDNSLGTINFAGYPAGIAYSGIMQGVNISFDLVNVPFIQENLVIGGSTVSLNHSFTRVDIALPSSMPLTAVPEPASYAVIASILLLVFCVVKQKRFLS